MDAGLSRREARLRLEAIGESIDKIDAILVTHEHTDHVSGLVRIARPRNIPIHATLLTAPTIDWGGYEPRLHTFQAGTGFKLGDIRVESFTIPHDAVDPVGFSFHLGGMKLGVVTDLGYMPESVRWHLRGTDLLVLESNHNLEMLKVGPYPWAVKQRVMGRKGHLSNDAASDFVREGMDRGTTLLVLAHLSENNNHPELARQAARQALDAGGLKARLVVALPRRQTEVFEF